MDFSLSEELPMIREAALDYSDGRLIRFSFTD